MGQMKMTKEQATKAAKLFGLGKEETLLLQEVPYRGSLPELPPTEYAKPVSSLMTTLCALLILRYKKSGSNATGGCLTLRRRVRSNTCMPWGPAPSETTNAWFL
jgi:hypothetical protein